MNQLDSRPELYKSVLQKRRREEKEEAGLVSFLKVTSLLSTVSLLAGLCVGEAVVSDGYGGHLLLCL